MAQKITIHVAGFEFALNAQSPEHERMIREASELIEKKLDTFSSRYPDVALDSKLCYLLLSEVVARFAVQNELASLRKETSDLLSQTDSYLEKIERQ